MAGSAELRVPYLGRGAPVTVPTRHSTQAKTTNSYELYTSGYLGPRILQLYSCILQLYPPKA